MKSLMREFVTVGIAASSLFSHECDARAQELTLDQLIQHNVQAVGGGRQLKRCNRSGSICG